MKKNYDLYIAFLTIIIFIFEIIFVRLLFVYKMPRFICLNAIVEKDGLYHLILDNHELKLLNNNEVIYYKNKKIKFNVNQVTKNILSRNNKKYSSVLIEFKIDKKLKKNDVLNIFIRESNNNIIDIFNVIWKGD